MARHMISVLEALDTMGYTPLEVTTLLDLPGLAGRMVPKAWGVPVPLWLARAIVRAGVPHGSLPNCGARRRAVRRVVLRACLKRGVPAALVVGPALRQTARAVAARREIIAALYDPRTAGSHVVDGRAWGISKLGRVIGLNHSSVLRLVRQAGVHGGARECCA